MPVLYYIAEEQIRKQLLQLFEGVKKKFCFSLIFFNSLEKQFIHHVAGTWSTDILDMKGNGIKHNRGWKVHLNLIHNFSRYGGTAPGKNIWSEYDRFLRNSSHNVRKKPQTFEDVDRKAFYEKLCMIFL